MRDTNLNVISGDTALLHPLPPLILHYPSLSLTGPHILRFNMSHLMSVLLVSCLFLPRWFSAVGFFGSGSFTKSFTRPTFNTTLASKTEKETPWLC